MTPYTPTPRRPALLAAWLLCLGGFAAPALADDPGVDVPPRPLVSAKVMAVTAEASPLIDAGNKEYANGRFARAIEAWSSARDKYASVHDADGVVGTSISISMAQQMLGQYNVAIDTLEAVQKTELDKVSPERLIALKSTLGLAYAYSRRGDEARESLNEALKLASQAVKSPARGVVEYDLAVVEAMDADFVQTLKFAQQAAQSAADAGDDLTAARAQILIAETSVEFTALANVDVTGVSARDTALNPGALSSSLKTTLNLPDSHDKMFLLVHIGDIALKFAHAIPDARAAHIRKAFDADNGALNIALALKDSRSESLALGALGELYELDGRHDEALKLTRRAAFLAQELGSYELLYRWQWQTGRILVAQGDRPGAIDAYLHAIDNLQKVRNDLALGHDNLGVRASFRKSVGPVYFEAADLLLQEADAQSSPAKANELLIKARDTVELLKAAEVADFFESECVNQAREKIAKIDTNVAPNTAIIYIIPLAGRTEILMNLPSGLKRYKVPATSKQIEDQANQMRLTLETRGDRSYLPSSRLLYDWLVRPLESDLARDKVDTLVFVPDGPLRTVPMGALQDGHDFLIKHYAVAITPGLSLMEPKPIDRQNFNVLMSGLSVSRLGYPALESVQTEMGAISKLYGGDQLLNETFSQRNLQSELRSHPVSVVHIASHGNFGPDAKSTFILTYDDKITMDGLEHLIRPVQYSGQPVELLTLSACQTAAGDDRSALGLAGVALKAGARSALATLWYVSDEGSNVLVTDFYEELKNDPTCSKAKALQRSQLKLMQDRRFEHPCYWSPYLIIGNWL